MSSVKVTLNRSAVKELLKSAKMEAVCKAEATKVKNKCGDGYEVNTFVGKNRVNAGVSAVTKEAREDNLQNNTLLKAVSK